MQSKQQPLLSHEEQAETVEEEFYLSEAHQRNMFCRHFCALFRKRWQYTKRDKKAFVFQLVIPVCQVLLPL